MAAPVLAYENLGLLPLMHSHVGGVIYVSGTNYPLCLRRLIVFFWSNLRGIVDAPPFEADTLRTA